MGEAGKGLGEWAGAGPGAPVGAGGAAPARASALTFPEDFHVALLQEEAELGEVVLQYAPCAGGRKWRPGPCPLPLLEHAPGHRRLLVPRGSSGRRAVTGAGLNGHRGWEHKATGPVPTDELHGHQLQVLVAAAQVTRGLHEKLVVAGEVALHLETGQRWWSVGTAAKHGSPGPGTRWGWSPTGPSWGTLSPLLRDHGSPERHERSIPTGPRQMSLRRSRHRPTPIWVAPQRALEVC